MGRLDTVPSWFAQNQPTTSSHQNHDPSSRCMADLLLEANWGTASRRKMGGRVGGKEGGGEKESKRERKGERGALWLTGGLVGGFVSFGQISSLFLKNVLQFWLPWQLIRWGHN